MNEISYLKKLHDSYKIGNNLIDEQHEKVFSIGMNMYKNILSSNKEKKNFIILNTLSKLIQVLKEHYKDEESLMKNLDIPLDELNAHTKDHERIFALLKKKEEMFLKNENITIEDIKQTFNIINSAILDHLNMFDISIKEYLHNDDE